MSCRFVLTLLCSALFTPFILQTASAAPSCDSKTLRRVFSEITELQREESLLESRTNRLLRAVYNRGEGAAENLLEQLQRAERETQRQDRLCINGNERACSKALRLEDYIETLNDAIDLLRFDITEAMDALVTRSSNIGDEITSDLDRATAFMRECLSDDR